MKKTILALTIFVFCIIAFVSCRAYQKARIRSLSSGYRDKYGKLDQPLDTVITYGKLCCAYNDGILREVGKKRDGVKVGKWFYYDDSLKLTYVVKYRKNGIDTLRKPFVLINEPW